MQEVQWGYIDQLNRIFDTLELTNISVAKQGGPDASLISRYRKGTRKPPENGQQLKKLALGIVCMAREKNQVNKLYTLCDISSEATIEEGIECLYHAMKQALPISRRQEKKQAPEKKLYDFSERLDFLMQALDVSNIVLARALHVDASLVSRFRTGMRIPSKKNWFPLQCVNWLGQRALALDYGTRLERLSPYLGEVDLTTEKNIVKALKNFLMSKQGVCKETVADDLLNYLNTFQYNQTLPKKFVEKTLKMANAKEKNSRVYYGLDGLRQSVLEFLFVVVAYPQPVTLYLYSNQPMDWMTQNVEYAKLWGGLMGLIIQKGHQIRIIHHVERSMQEMFEAIQKWLPLYMSGQIQAYYCEKKAERFYQTRFILPGYCSVDANMVIGTQNQAEYLFCTNKERVKYHMQQFEALLKESKPLLHTYKLNNIKVYEDLLIKDIVQENTWTCLRATLPLATMPEAVFESMLKRTSCSAQDRHKLGKLYHRQVDILIHKIKKRIITDLIPLHTENQLIASKILSPLPEALIGEKIYYTADEYKAHIACIQQLLMENTNYHVYLLPEVPFEHIEIMIQEKHQAIIVRTETPFTAFSFKHPSLCQAYEAYLKKIVDKVMPQGYKRQEIITMLKKISY